MNPSPSDTDQSELGADLTRRLSATMDDLDTVPHAMAADAIRLGRPRRRRRLAVSVAGGVVALALVGGVGAYGLSAVSTTRTAVPAASPTVKPPPPADAPTMAVPTKDPSKAPARGSADRRLPARVGALYLTRLAPSGSIASYVGQQSEDEIYLGAPIDRGDGPVDLMINVQGAFFGATTGPGPKQDPNSVAEFYTCDREFEHFAACSVTRRKDGSVLLVSTTVISRSRPAGVVVVADFLRADGTRVVVSSGNTKDVKYGGVVRRGVTVAQARAIVTDPVWDLYQKPTDRDVAQARRQINPWKLLPN